MIINNNILLSMIIGVFLSSNIMDVSAAPWECRPAADGKNWQCEREDGSYESAIPQVTTKQFESLDASENVGDDDLYSEVVPENLRWVNPEFLTHKNIWQHCSTHRYDEYRALREHQQIDRPDRTEAETHVVSDHLEFLQNDNIAHFVGSVVINRADQRIQGSHISFDNEENTATVLGDVTFKETGLIFTNGSEAFFNLGDNTGSMENVDFVVETAPSRGRAEHVEVESKFISHFTNIEYTTCPPGNRDWMLGAEQLTLNMDTGIGDARHATLEFLGLPILYSPYYSFPLDDRRKSGILAPTFGISAEDGLDISVPYYWDIAANFDATFFPRYLSKRGVQMGGEFRYLLPQHEGVVFAEFLPDDDLRGDDRGFFSYQNDSRFSSNVTGKINLNYASDNEYFEDFGISVSQTSVTQLERLGELLYQDDYSTATARLQYFQTVDDTINEINEPFQRLPQLAYIYDRDDQWLGLSHHFSSELVYFEHASSRRETGARIDLRPGVSLPVETLGWFVIPRLDFRYTYYDLDTQANLTDDQFDRSLPIFSLDSGIFLEKNTTIFGDRYLQTLEPRLFYLNVPFRSQNNFPNFDTSEFDFSSAQLFRDNRFNNADRQGDANQLTYAITTRFLNETSGREIIDASFGQIIFFEDRDVVLGAKDRNDEESSSPYVVELGWNITQNFRTRYSIQYDPHEEVTDRNEFRIRYARDNSHLFNVDYRQRRGILEQTDISFRWKLSNEWHAIGRNHYSLLDHHVIENFAGLEYESCCWIGRMLVHYFVDDIEDIDQDGDNEGEFALFFQLELKGLANIGNKITDVIQEGVINYESFEY